VKNGIPYPFHNWDYIDLTEQRNSFDPLGSYTGRTLERGEKPIQDADDL